MSFVTLDDIHMGPQEIAIAPAGTLFCDIEGTIADLAHRRVYVESKPKNWKQFKARMDRDTPIAHVISAVQALSEAGWTVVMRTGRDAYSRGATETWLARHNVPFERLYMRADGDFRSDDIVKEELLLAARFDGYEPNVILDDRNQVVDMWRRHNLRCIQVAFGDF